MPTAAPRSPALDGMRGMAVAAVVAFHLDRLSGGWLGVDAFFTLSGYLITALLLAETANPKTPNRRVDLRQFWRRRIRRLQPAAVVCIAAIVATARWWSPPGTGRAVRGDALASLFSVANWHMLWSHQPYAAGGSPSAFEHFWSLAIEEQFYVIWPLAVAAIVVLAKHRTRAFILGAAVAGTIASWVLLATYGEQRGYLSTQSRIGSILAGAALACVLGNITDRKPRRVVGTIGIVGMVVMWFGAGWPPHAPLAVILPVHTAFAIMAIVGVPSFMGWRPLAQLGLVSYGVYLWHWPVIVILTPERLGQNEFVTDAIRLVVIAALTALSWNFIERPVRRGHVLRATRFAYPIAAAVVAMIVVLTAGTVAPTPSWARANGDLVQARAPVAQVVRPPRRAHRVLVIGDSLPTSLLSGTDSSGTPLQRGEGRLLEQLAAAGIASASATITACPVLDEAVWANNSAQDWCAPLTDRVLRKSAPAFKPDLVVWFDVADGYEIQYPNGRREDPIDSPAAAARLRARYAARLKWFATLKAKVVFVSPGPVHDGHDAEDLRRDSYRSMAFLDDTLHSVAAANRNTVAGVIEMSDITCPDWRRTHHCADVTFDGHHYRERDGMHYALSGAVVASAWLAKRIATLDLEPAPSR